MSEHRAIIQWKKKTPDFVYETYDRTHQIKTEGGVAFSGSAAPEFMGKKEHANPEELLAATLGSCHMLTFLAICAKARLTVESYDDTPVAVLDKKPDGRMGVTKIVLNPKVTFGGEAPAPEKLKELHDKAHKYCFIANSLACAVAIEPR